MTKDDIQEFIDDYISPGLKMHDGYLVIDNFDEEKKHLKIRLGGGCQGCASSEETLKLMVENFLKEEFPELEKVEDVTKHSEGESPYYSN
jgi:Fe/S biogenesis protein NfuA